MSDWNPKSFSTETVVSGKFAISRSTLFIMPPARLHAQTHKNSEPRNEILNSAHEWLAETSRLEQLIGLDYVTETILGSPITAVCIGVVALHQFFIARLYIFASGFCT